MEFQAHTIIEEASFSESVDELIMVFPRLDEVKSAVDWQLARDPYYGMALPIKHYYVLNTIPVGMPSFTILYRYEYDPESNDNCVYLVDIKVRSPGEGEW